MRFMFMLFQWQWVSDVRLFGVSCKEGESCRVDKWLVYKCAEKFGRTVCFGPSLRNGEGYPSSLRRKTNRDAMERVIPLLVALKNEQQRNGKYPSSLRWKPNKDATGRVASKNEQNNTAERAGPSHRVLWVAMLLGFMV